MELILDNINIKEILLSGACFRSKENDDGSITTILKDRVVIIKQDGNKINIKSSNYDNLKEIIYNYFDIYRDYESINNELISNNKDLSQMINKCKNYRILNQDSFEMCISYIISQNNKVSRISSSIEMICKDYGKKISFEGNDYYLFPTYEDLKNISVEKLHSYKIGFRDKYIRDYLDKYETLLNIDELNTTDALKALTSVKGIGLKVASCILLFGYKRLDVFPIDTWVRKYISENYNIKNDMKSIKEFASYNFKEYSGLVIQYMFHSQRNM